MHSSYALRVSALSLPLLIAGCVGAGLGPPSYIDFLPPPAVEGGGVRVRELVETPNASLSQLLEAAELGNPRIEAARHSAGAAAGRAWQAELYPNPTLEFEAEGVPAGSPGLERSENTVSLTQPLIVGGRRSAAIAAARAAGDARSLTLEQTRRDVAAETRRVWTDLLYLQGAAALTSDLVTAARSTHEIASTRLEARATPESEVLKAQVEVDRLELRLRRLGRDRHAALQRLASLVGLEQVALVRLSGQLPRELPVLEFSALVGRLVEHPGLLAAKTRTRAALRQVDLAEAQRIPDLGLRFAYGRNNSSDQQILEGGISIPLPLFNRNQGRIHSAQQVAKQRQRSAEAMERRLHADLASALADYGSARDAAATHREQIVPAAERAFTLVREGYRAGRAGFLDLLDAQRTLAQVRLSELTALRDAHRALSRLTQLTGPLAAR